MNWTEWLARLEGALPRGYLTMASDLDWNLIGVVAMYGFAVAWLVYRWVAYRRRGRRERPLAGMWIMDGFVRLLVSAMLMVLVILLALGRAEGRSPYYYRNRF